MKTTAILLLIVVFELANAQVESRPPHEASEIPIFYVDALSFSSDDSLSSRVDLYMQVPYEALQFVKVDDHYRSKYEVTFNFLTEDNASVLEKVWSEEVLLQTFDQTQSRKAFSLSQRSAVIAPGIYTMRVQLRDNESKKISTVVKKIIVGNYSMKELSVSDVLLVNKVTHEGDHRNIAPNISGNIGENNNSFYLFFEVYTPNPNDSLELHYIIADLKGKQLLNKFQTYRAHAYRSQILTRFDSTQYSTGSYLITIETKSLEGDGNQPPAIKQKAFIVRWGSMPVTVNDLDLAIKQLRYIAREGEYDKISDAKTEEEKRRLFEEFWKRRDPNPDTKRNENMEEYYSRVEYANEHFSHYVAGWKTDMGMVFILFGSPNSVERHPFDIDSKPYEVWAYYDFNRQIVFVDETGFGDYRLLTPIWDLLQRLKY